MMRWCAEDRLVEPEFTMPHGRVAVIRREAAAKAPTPEVTPEVAPAVTPGVARLLGDRRWVRRAETMAGPVCTVVWEEVSRETPSYPDWPNSQRQKGPSNHGHLRMSGVPGP